MLDSSGSLLSIWHGGLHSLQAYVSIMEEWFSQWSQQWEVKVPARLRYAATPAATRGLFARLFLVRVASEPELLGCIGAEWLISSWLVTACMPAVGDQHCHACPFHPLWPGDWNQQACCKLLQRPARATAQEIMKFKQAPEIESCLHLQGSRMIIIVPGCRKGRPSRHWSTVEVL